MNRYVKHGKAGSSSRTLQVGELERVRGGGVGGTGATANGIIGGGAPQGIIGGGAALEGIQGSGAALQGISGGA